MFRTLFSKAALQTTSIVALLTASLAAASAETLMMPDRDAKVGEQVVVWGVSDLPNGTAYEIDFGDGSPVVAGVVADGSYINTTHTYSSGGLVTATLTVGGEVATTEVAVFDTSAITPLELRQLDVNMAIEDGLRRLWVDQNSRAANFPASPTTSWGISSYTSSETAFVVAAFQNQGYQLPNDPNEEPTGVYEKYVVDRGIHYVVEGLTTQPLGVTPQGDNPCVGVALDGDECVGLFDRRQDVFHQSYTTGVANIALAASGALNRVVDASDVPNNLSNDFVVGRTYRDILQRMSNALAWGQMDAAAGCDAGGWDYSFNGSTTDGSTIGWVVLGLLDAEAAGIIVPQWVNDEFVNAMDASINDDGSLDYRDSSCNPAIKNSVGTEKHGIGLQGLFFIGEESGARRDLVRDMIDPWFSPPGIGSNNWSCGFADENLGCAYTMYNNFKGLRLQGINTLPSVGRPAGPGGIPANDWYAYYVDWFLANQTNPTDPNGGGWSTAMNFSPIPGIETSGETAIAELILANVALVLPDPELFADFGLTPLLQELEIENVTEATVTARAVADTGADPNDPSDDTPVPGAQVSFQVISGPSAGETGVGSTNANGEVSFTYSYGGPPEGNETDVVQAFIGDVGSNIPSNTVEVVWIGPNAPPVAVCQDVVRECVAGAVTNDVTASSFDGGSSDPDGDALSFDFDPAPPLPLSPAGSTVGTLFVSDPSNATDQCLATFTVEDTLAPQVFAEFLPVAGSPGVFEVNFGVTDSCDPAPVIQVAGLRFNRCGNRPAIDGQLIDFNPNYVGQCSVNELGGDLEVDATRVILRVVAADAAGNRSFATAVLDSGALAN